MNNNSNSQYAGKSNAELLAIINGLEAKVASKGQKELTFHISENTGAMVIRGFGRFPKTFYVNEFERLVAKLDDAKAFVEKYRNNMATKDADYDAKKSLAGVPESVIIRVKAEEKSAA